MTLEELERDIRACTACVDNLRKYGIVPRPIFSGHRTCPIVLLGQAPGITEYDKQAPFQGSAGDAVKALFAACGLEDFEGMVYQTSVTKCFPGRRARASTDRCPSVSEVKNCRPFLERQLSILQPKLLVCLGGLAWRAFLELKEAEEPGFCRRELPSKSFRNVKVPDVVGRQFSWQSTAVLPMIHPSGAANGSRARYAALNEASKGLLKTLLAGTLPASIPEAGLDAA